ncbi:MAG TPA: PIG-L family deacetylase [Gemmatimonadales bacterium]|nr:PIG-L family deacetylase [Gemmatimonadales bacterium]
MLAYPLPRVVLTAGASYFLAGSSQCIHQQSCRTVTDTHLAKSPATARSFAFLGGVLEGQEILQALLREGWQPGIILALTDEALRGASGGQPWPESFAGIPVTKVPSFQAPEAMRALGAAAAQGALCGGISEILRQPFLAAFPLGVYGFHGSLLPALAGPAPVNWAIIQGLSETGTTLLRYTTDLDGGTVVGQKPCPIDERETPGTLYQKLSGLSAALWLEHWPAIASGNVPDRPLGRLPLSPRRRPEDGLIRWPDHTAQSLDRWVRALSRPYPGAYFWFKGRRIWVHAAEPLGTPKQDGVASLASGGPDNLVARFPDGGVRLSDLRLDQDAPVPAHLMAQLAEHAGQPLHSLHRGRKVLAVAAHPDDEVLGAGGTLIRHFKSGDEVRVLIVCSAHSIRYREGEHEQPADAQRASHYLGARTVGLGFPDQRLDAGSNLELIQSIEQEIRDFQPDVVFTHHWGDVNADHVRIAEAVDVATRPYAAPFIRRIYGFETPSSSEWTASQRDRPFTPNVFCDITGELDRKLDAMRCYRSELRPYPHPRSLRSLRERAGYWGSVANMTAAEPLMLLRARE